MTDPAGLLGEMTLEEKAAQLGAVWSSRLVRADGQLDLEAARVLLRDGIGHLTRVSSETGLPPERTAAIVNDLQRILVEETRLGVPAIVHEEALAGVCANGATQFPQAIGMAATWNPDLVEEAAVAIRAELRAGGARQALAPVLDVTRDPRWGRLEETYGEDPYLAARMGVAYVRGLQGEDLATGVAATAKHFLAYGFPEGGMNHASAVIGARLLRDVVAAPFRAAINEAGLASVMAAYNDVDGLPCHGSAEILDALLRRELGFGGVVVADYFGIQLLASWHGLARADEDAAAVAIESGIDLELPTTQAYRNLPALVRAGRVGQGLVDRSCLRLLELKERLGLFTDPFAPEGGAAPFDRPGHRVLARRVAEESIVVCTNDGVLPLRAGADLAVIGPSADDGRLFLGDYGYPAHVEIIHEVAQYEGPQVAGGRIMPALEQVPTATALDGLRSSGFRVRHVRGCDVQSADRSDIPAAVEAARRSEVAVVCVGGRSGLTGEATSGEFRDASALGLPGVQGELVDAVLDTGTPTVVVLVGGRIHALPGVATRAGALVWAWLPGQEGGTALARVLSGAAAPSGRLPVTVPRSVGQVPTHYDHLSGAGRSQMRGDYFDAPAAPLFPFGHGLSLTTFEYDALAVDASHGPDELVVELTVTNTGARPGVEVVQVYVRDEVASVSRPARSLAGFAKVALEPQARTRVSLSIDPARLGFHGADLRYRVEPGTFTVMVGASAEDIRLRESFELDGEVRFPDPNRLRPTVVGSSVVPA